MKQLLFLLFFVLLAAVSARAAEKSNDARLDEVERRGAHVMPFYLEQTTHIFTKTACPQAHRSVTRLTIRTWPMLFINGSMLSLATTPGMLFRAAITIRSMARNDLFQ